MIKISLTNISAEFRFDPKPFLTEEARDFTFHFPNFKHIAKLAIQKILHHTLEGWDTLMNILQQLILCLRQKIICPLVYCTKAGVNIASHNWDHLTDLARRIQIMRIPFERILGDN